MPRASDSQALSREEGEGEGRIEEESTLLGTPFLGGHRTPTGGASGIAAQMQEGLQLVCSRSVYGTAAPWLKMSVQSCF